MADWLLIRLPRVPDQTASWLTVDPRGAPTGPPQSGPLSLAAPRSNGRRICVLVPGTDVLLADPELPPKAGAKQLPQLVPYALEEQLADDIDDLHFAIGKRPADSSKTPVAVVTRTLMDQWTSSLKENGLEPEVMYADSDLLPHNPGQSVALLEEDIVVVRPPSGLPVTLPADALHEALEMAQSSNPDGGAGRGLVLYTGAPEWHEHSNQVESLRERFDGIKIQLLASGPLSLFGQQLPTATATNLLQGPYTPTTSRAVGLRAWRVAAMLLVSLVALHVAGKAAELSLLKRSEHKLDVSIREAVQSVLPGQGATADARKMLEQRLAAARAGGGGLLPALEALVQAKSAAPGATLQALSFHNGALDLKIAAPDASSLDRIGQALRNNGWQADLTSGTNVANGYEGRLQMHSNGS